MPDMKHALFPLAELEPGQMRSAEVNGIALVVVRTQNGGVHVLRDRCSHEGAKLSNGRVFETVDSGEGGGYTLSRDQFVIRCPWHGYEFDVVSGRCLADPSRARARAYPVTIEDGIIFVER